METTKKTSTTKAALLVLAALSMLLSGLFIATASRSDASPPSACPDGFSLTADAKNCFQVAAVTSADNPNSCDTGQLTPDSTKCYVAARIIPQQGQTLCPKGYSPDDSLGSMCARFDAAAQRAKTCPAGSHGVVSGCYILVAKGPRGAATCTNTAGELVGDSCVITGTAPAAGPSTCPTSATVLEDGTECYRLVGQVGGVCVAPNRDDASGDCRSDVAKTPGALGCATGFAIIGAECLNYEAPVSANPQCPTGSAEDGAGACRKPVADTDGAYYCTDANAALNGKSCVWTAGFLIELSPDLYKCDAGARTVIGAQVICILGDANANVAPSSSCLQGVPSTDSAYCIVARIDAAPAAVAAPVPSFTG